MSSIVRNPTREQIVINISPNEVQNKNKRAKITRDASLAVIGLLNGNYSGALILRSVGTLTPEVVDELVRSIEQTLIEIVGLTSFREYSQTIIKEGEITFAVQPGDRIYTVEYNLILPTDFQVRQVVKNDPLEKIAPLLNSGPLDSTSLQNHSREFYKDARAPNELRESDTVQFKKVKSDKTKNKSTAERILANKITHYVAAFANHKGGHVYIGIDDETYAVCGQAVNEEEKGRITEKIESAITNMVWLEENGKPERGKHWDIAFIPVLDEVKKIIIPDLFVIVLSVACCPGGVFVAVPETYVTQDGEVKKMPFEQWKKRILHDAYMRDIIKFIRENAWKEAVIPKDSKVDKDSDKDEGLTTSAQTSNFEPKCESLVVAIPQQVKPSTTKRRRNCQKITDYMEQLIHGGSYVKLKDFASKIHRMPVKSNDNDTKVAVGIMLSLGAYCRRNFSAAYEELSKISALISSTENHMEFELQHLQLLACLLRGERKYNKSFEVVYGGLQRMDSISPGWYTAWILNESGCLFSILATQERNEEVHQSLKQQACVLFAKAISHASMIDNDASHSTNVAILKSSLVRRCHIRQAMVYLGYSPQGDVINDMCVVSPGDVETAIKNILAVEESSLKGDPLTSYNECYLHLAKSDLSYRKSQLYQDQSGKFLKTAKEHVTKAEELALLRNFPGILKYSESRRRRFSKLLSCAREREEELLADLSDN